MKKLSIIILAFAVSFTAKTQEKLAVINFDIVGNALTKQQCLSITRNEISKLGRYIVIDKYTVQESLETNVVNFSSCYGTSCLLKVGKHLNADYVVAGEVEIIVDKAIITLRLIDVKNGESIKTSYSEYYWSESSAERLIQLSVLKLFNVKTDDKLLNIYDYDKVKQGVLEGPQILKYDLSGPRFGGVYQTGIMGEVLTQSKNEGGFDKQQFMTVIGYQYEQQYLFTGTFQAVFQTNFSLTGLDQQMALPSLTFINGFRSTVNGWEFGFGPSFRLRRSSEGFYRTAENGDRTWHLSDEALAYENPDKFERLDSRGNTRVISSWVWGVGKSFRAGNMNIPVNIYVVPDNDGWLFGFSMGYALDM
jgi:TolB-like protein